MSSDNVFAPHDFSKLYEEHHAWLVRWLARRTNRLDNAQDLAQDTFLRVLMRPYVLDNLGHPRAWLAKVANNLIVDQARRQLLEKHYLELMADLPEQEVPSVEEQLQLLELLDRIDRMLDGLRPLEKTTFLMSRLDGLTYKEIAEQLGISLSSVEKYMAKAMLACYKAAYQEGH